jgi:hypothetical protein
MPRYQQLSLRNVDLFTERETIDLVSPRSPKPKASDASERLHRTSDVPQADKLFNVRRLAAAIREGLHHPAALRELLDVDDRHFNYYRQATEILGLITSDLEGTFKLTGRGQELLGTGEGSIEERACFGEAIRDARALKPFSSFFEGDELPLSEVAKRLEVMTGLSPSTATRRASTLLQWRRYVKGSPGKALPEAPNLPMMGDQLASLIAHHNALAKQRFLEWLLKVEPGRFESIVADLVSAMGHSDVSTVGGSGDGGVDVVALKTDQWGSQTAVVIQVKRYAKSLGRRWVDELIGVLTRRRVSQAILITTSDFSLQAVEAAKEEPRVRLVHGAQLVDLMSQHGVLIRYGRFGEIEWVSDEP